MKKLYLVKESVGYREDQDLIIVRAYDEQDAEVVAADFLDNSEIVESGYYKAVEITDTWRTEEIDKATERLDLLCTVNELTSDDHKNN